MEPTPFAASRSRARLIVKPFGLPVMISIVPQWPYLEQVEGVMCLQSPGTPVSNGEVGDWCGEWGAYLDDDGHPAGVRLMFVPDCVSTVLLQSKNVADMDRDLIVSFQDSRLPDIDAMPFLPVYRGRLQDGREIFQLSGYE